MSSIEGIEPYVATEENLEAENEVRDNAITVSHEKNEKLLDIKEISDAFFDVLLVENLIVSYEKDMLQLGFTKNHMDEFMSEINNMSITDQKKILSFPYEQRQIFFKNKLTEVENKQIDIKQFTEELLDFATEGGYTIGFHVAPRKIDKILNRDKRETWSVKGTQNDHRDSDIPMAYYSKQYRHLYAHKTFEYIYIVRSAPDHRTDGNWFRAPSLSVVSEIKINPQILQEKMEVELRLKKEEAQRINDAPLAA